ncbi:Zn-dependent alcohol dehydrogenase [Tupanvirus soda lake]|uniref:Zn-dependent alcohol dehydrogenase n=2 Tax=Tupanvirus TaxID=2094720 RepID=A0A6N1NT29_9VIRU|nr:Zn-dependent alcohol dehydrogenase [Tupanvirus soda lake]QKU34798.1 Zn-dependent alcohol dehydrogenase [Tupanvirus soda lake]
MYVYKLEKYKNKLISTKNKNKFNHYLDKIKYYEKMIGGDTHLLQPQRINKENLDKNTNKIIAHGYGLMKKYKDLEPIYFERRKPYPQDVVIEILYAGVCHSDWHYIIGEWDTKIPLVPGHEICGRITKRGTDAKKFNLGDIVLVGPYVNSCQKCKICTEGHEQYCENEASWTYNGTDRRPGELVATGEPTHGGYSTIITVNENFVFLLPSNLPKEKCAPLLCAGITTYSPLKQMNIKPGQKVGVAGVGGLGHMAIKFAKAMGAYVVALTTTEWKLEDTLGIGADESVLVTNIDDIKKYKASLDFIVDTIPKIHDFNFYLDLLKYNDMLWIVGFFDQSELNIGNISSYNRSIRASIIGGISEIKEMLEFCSKHKIYPETEIIRLEDINKTYNKLLKSSVRYRYVIDITL